MERAHKNSRPSLFDTPAGFDDPLGMLLGCHRRIEKKLATLKALCDHVAEKGVDAEASVAAQGVLRYFDSAAPHHHADEEKDLFPLLESRIQHSEERGRVAALGERLRAEHRDMEALWARIRKPLEAIAEGLHKTLPGEEVEAFVTLYRNHLEIEEDIFERTVDRWLTDRDRHSLGKAMAARRGTSFPM